MAEYIPITYPGYSLIPTRTTVTRYPPTVKWLCFSEAALMYNSATKMFCTSYVIKYASGTDEKRDMALTVSDDSECDVNVEPFELHNAKIGGASRVEKKYRVDNDCPEAMAKELSSTDVKWFMLDLKYVDTNVLSVEVICVPFERRSSMLKSSTRVYGNLRDDNEEIIGVVVRNNYPAWRRFTAEQILHMDQIINGKYYADAISRFNVRPPELLIVDQVRVYFRLFSYHTRRNEPLTDDVLTSSFVDGLNRVVKIREQCLGELSTILQDTNCPAGLSLRETVRLLLLEVDADEKSAFWKRLADSADVGKEVSVSGPFIDPCSVDFFHEYALALGRFQCEFQLFAAGNVIGVFRTCRLAHLPMDR